MRRAIWILWPSFVVAGVADVLFFSFVDPLDFRLLGAVGLSRLGAYSVTFFVFWIFAAASSAFTCFLQQGVRS